MIQSKLAAKDLHTPCKTIQESGCCTQMNLNKTFNNLEKEQYSWKSEFSRET